MIELTDEMVQALWRKLPSDVQEGREPDDIEPWVEAILATVEQGYRLDPYCNAELMPGAVCKLSRVSSSRHKHEAILPATGNRVEWS